VRAVANLEGNGEDVGGAVEQLLRGQSQPPAADIGHDRQAGDRAEAAGQMETRDAADIGDVIKGDVLGEAGLDEPDGAFDKLHGGPAC
jgi:hypothetical protein